MYLLLCLLFSLFYYSSALTYEQCLNHVFNQTNIDLFADSGIYAGRYDDCIISCDQRYYYKLVCYSEYGYHYDAWWALFMFGSILAFLYSSYCFICMIKAESDSKPKFNPQFITIGSNLFLSFIKIIWMICIFNGKDDNNVIGGIYVDIVIIKLVQSVLLSEIFMLILIWKTIVDTTTNLKKIDKAINDKNYYYNIVFISIIMLIIFPFSILGRNFQILNIVSNMFIVITIVCLIIASISYSFKLTKILNKGINDLKRKNAIINIKFVNNTLCLVGIIACIMTFINNFRLFESPFIKLWLWVSSIHMIEFVCLFTIAYSTSYKARHSDNSNTSHSNFYSFVSTRISTFKSNKNNRIISASTVVSTNQPNSIVN